MMRRHEVFWDRFAFYSFIPYSYERVAYPKFTSEAIYAGIPSKTILSQATLRSSFKFILNRTSASVSLPSTLWAGSCQFFPELCFNAAYLLEIVVSNPSRSYILHSELYQLRHMAIVFPVEMFFFLWKIFLRTNRNWTLRWCQYQRPNWLLDEKDVTAIVCPTIPLRQVQFSIGFSCRPYTLHPVKQFYW